MVFKCEHNTLLNVIEKRCCSSTSWFKFKYK